MAGEFATGEESKQPSDKKHADGVTRRSMVMALLGAAGGAGVVLASQQFTGSKENPLSHDEQQRRLNALNAAMEKAEELGVDITDEQLTEVVGTYVLDLEQQKKAARDR